ncbi:MAG TPA: S8 family serine peptidase, partial [Bacteroidota bacterium]|nr:S8 family serine peptidase [Bacteroidota bacterium]
MKLLIFTTFFSLRVLSQTWLEQFSKQRGEKWQAERVHAESLARALNMPIRLDRTDGTTIELQRFENGRPLYYKTDNLNAAKTISTNKVWPAGGFGFSLTGNGIALGEWDAGKVRTTHQEFGGRVTSTQGTNNFHSTHVAGTMVASGVVASAQGMSYQAFLNAFDWNNDAAEMASQANLGLRVSNHSYGFISGWDFDSRGDNRWAWWGEPIISPIEDYTFGFYDASAKAWDLVAQNAPYYLIVNSAGNDRNEGPNGTVEHWVWNGSQWVLQTVARNKDCAPLGYDCLSDVSLSKNVLTVGAVNDIPNGYTTPGGVVMSSFSSWGPTDDGRIKPDIVANGVSLNSTLESADNDYGTLSGTSMASPNVAGSIGLLLEHQNNLHGTSPLLSSTLKAIILHTADEAGPNPGPDYTNGWGLMNTLKAVQLMSLDSIDGPNSHIRELILNQGDSILISVSSTGLEPLRATICWTDPPGQPVAPALDPPTIMLKNDVDLRIIREKDQTYYFPWILDPTSPSSPATTADNIRDNVEQVYIQNPERGVHLVKITHKSTLTDAPQHVSLIMSGNVPRIGPYVIAQPTNFSYELLPGGSRQDSVKIRNNGDTTLIYEISATPPSGWLTVSEDTGSIQPLDSTFINFTVDAALLSQWTTYNGTVSILSNDSGQTPYDVAVTLQTLGPTIEVTPLTIVADMDSGDTKDDSLKIKNSGFIPLTFSIRSSDPVFPQWLTLSDTAGTLSPGDSLFVRMTF